MPRFYYDIEQDGAVHKDAEGLELESLERARHEAVRTLCELALEEFSAGGDQQQLTLQVSDKAGRTVLVATISITIESAGLRRNPHAGAGGDTRDRTRPRH